MQVEYKNQAVRCPTECTYPTKQSLSLWNNARAFQFTALSQALTTILEMSAAIGNGQLCSQSVPVVWSWVQPQRNPELFLAVHILVWFVLWFLNICKWQRHGQNTDHFNIRFTCSNINAFLYFPKSLTLLSANLLIAAFTAPLHMSSLSSIWYVCWIKQVSLETWDVTSN